MQKQTQSIFTFTKKSNFSDLKELFKHYKGQYVPIDGGVDSGQYRMVFKQVPYKFSIFLKKQYISEQKLVKMEGKWEDLKMLSFNLHGLKLFKVYIRKKSDLAVLKEVELKLKKAGMNPRLY